MNSNSWLKLDTQDPRYQLPAELQAQDLRAARDCGWVEQMTPFIQHYAQPGDWVIDPFCGFGSTLVAASIAGRPALGVELDAQRVALTRARLDGLGLDAKRYPVWQGNLADAGTQERCRGGLGSVAGDVMPASSNTAQFVDSALPTQGVAASRIGLCLTNIPYFGCDPNEQGAPDQLYHARYYEPYLQGLRDVFNGIHAVLAPDAWCVVMVQNLRLGGRFVPLAWDVAKLLDERFVLHEERMLIYERGGEAVRDAVRESTRDPVHDAARPGLGGLSVTNRAHEYALVCRKQSRGLNINAGLDLLRALNQDGFAFVLYGSFADYLDHHAAASGQSITSLGDLLSMRESASAQRHRADPSAPREPNDIDLIVPPDEAELSRLMQRLERDGFRLESWNARVNAPVAIKALAYRYYFRARRVDQAGHAMQLDIAVAETQAVFDDQRMKRCSTTSLPH
ncbi:DNA methyltransferase [Pigmentiphaga aceris]|nr:DNA methyltransferase [Pigmentiphaga aceris]